MDNLTCMKRARAASRSLAGLSDAVRAEVLENLADRMTGKAARLLEANHADVLAMDPADPRRDRLLLTEGRLADVADSLRQVATLPDPLGLVLSERVRPNGLRIRKVSVPIGVLGVIYEARPNVTFDVFALCFKSGNACVLKGGKEADATNRAAIGLIHESLAACGVDPDCAVLLPSDREAAAALLEAVGVVDVIIPRGGAGLIRYARENARVPVIETGAGICHVYFDKAGDVSKGTPIVENAKTRRVSVCNALDCLLVHRDRLGDLPALCSPLAAHGVTLYAGPEAFGVLSQAHYPLLEPAAPQHFGTEFLDYKMAVGTVPSLEAAIDHIAAYGSGHSESIVTEDEQAARLFCQGVDAACVYVNAPTSFSDGGQFGLGAEIGISTQKLGARGPMGLEEITSYKWLINGTGQTRP